MGFLKEEEQRFQAGLANAKRFLDLFEQLVKKQVKFWKTVTVFLKFWV